MSRRYLRELAAAPLVAWHAVVSPLIAPRCRYEPSCSRYAAQAIHEFGILRGVVLAAWRLLRCNPFSRGGFDPPSAQRLFVAHTHEPVADPNRRP
ncbi:MAG TPA: membrane protein insertion efficiency factor YidD [Solirubrobacteraceae bacterium]|nr:membrane protein insertion efficiency factor YidD [Solirubrobacteraceae bacterium]